MFTPVPPALVAPSRRILDVLRRYRDLIVSTNRPVVTICGLAVNGVNADLARFRRDLDRARAVWGQCGITINEGSFTVIPGDLDYPNWVDYRAAPAALLAQRGTCGANAIRAYYVRSIAGNRFQGRSAFTFGDPGYVAMGDSAHPNLFPHELGHIFLGGNEEHRDGASPADLVNIMRSNVGQITANPPRLDQNQCARAAARIRTGGGRGGTMGALEARRILVEGLRAPDPMARVAALGALAATRSPLARAAIAERVRVEPDPNVRAYAQGLALGLRG